MFLGLTEQMDVNDLLVTEHRKKMPNQQCQSTEGNSYICLA